MPPMDYLVEYCSRKYVVVLGVSSHETSVYAGSIDIRTYQILNIHVGYIIVRICRLIHERLLLVLMTNE
jgi:hypothetical protein